MTRPTRQAVAVVIRDAGAGRLLAVRRPPDDDELPGAWGLPAATLRPGEGWREAVRRTGKEKLGVELRAGELLRSGEQERDDYRLRMRLYAAEVAAGRPSVPQDAEGVTQYTEWGWASPGRLEPAARRGSLCSRLCLEWHGEAAGPGPEGRDPPGKG